ncbi:hypothetical protein GCM10022276_05520 [Sphingomonas limnosediminicola]|uniref:Uncharacterized protein n=1 Tax=Sphingomonas limnosediminicola TaxID=940133 RepID=A0ABP7KXE5_9SPHN
MRALVSIPVAAFVVGSCAIQAGDVAAQSSALSLAGRTAGPPERCVLIQPTEAMRVSQSDPHALLYGRGRTIWLNRLAGQCSLNATYTLVTESIGSSYCRGDRVRSFDNFTHIPGNSCILGDFVPYRRAN